MSLKSFSSPDLTGTPLKLGALFFAMGGTQSKSDTSFIVRNPRNPTIDHLLVQASEYAVDYIDHRRRQAESDPMALQLLSESYWDIVCQLEVGYLFPNITDRERQLLISLMRLRNLIAGRLNNSGLGLDRHRQGETAAVIQESMDEFFVLAHELESSGLKKRLDPDQRRIVDLEFASIPLDRCEQTVLVFRKECVAAPPRATPKKAPVTPLEDPSPCEEPFVEGSLGVLYKVDADRLRAYRAKAPRHDNAMATL